MNGVARSALARLASFVPTAAATLIATRLIIEHYGVNAFDSFALILSIINLIPLNNLGVGASVTAAYAKQRGDRQVAERTVLTAARVLTVSTLATAAAAILLGLLGLWPTLLGGASGPNFWCAAALVVFALTFVPGLGTSVLLGVHRNHTTILIQTLFNPLIATFVAVLIVFDVPNRVLLIVPCVALLVIQLVTSGVASRAAGLSWRRVLGALPFRSRYPGASIRALSGPMLIITLSTPIAIQSDRIVLSHVASAQAVAEYSVAFQIFAPALVLIAASAQPLWPIYTRARSEGKRGPHVSRILLLFGGAAAAVGAVLALIANPVASLVAADRVHISPLLAFSGALVVFTSGLSYPVAMFLMDPIGVRLVLWCTVVAVPLNIALSIVLGRHLGAPGPLLASGIIGIGVQALPGIVYSRDRQFAGRHRRTRRADPMLEPLLAIEGRRLEQLVD